MSKKPFRDMLADNLESLWQEISSVADILPFETSSELPISSSAQLSTHSEPRRQALTSELLRRSVSDLRACLIEPERRCEG